MREAGRYNLVMCFVYILQSQKDLSYYTGFTEDVAQRLIDRNSGSAQYLSSKRPYKLIWHCVFQEKSKAIALEKYLKQGSGFAFARNHFV